MFENDDAVCWKTTIAPNNPLKMHRHDRSRCIVGLQGGTLKKTEEESKLLAAGIDDFEDKGIIGRGAFGTVRLVKSKDSNKFYALKYLIKDNIVKKKQQRHLK